MSLHRKKRSERGAAMVESLLAMFVIFLFLFGFLQVVYFFAGQYFAEYAALRGARSRCVGFADYLAQRETRVHAIGGSGLLCTPNLEGYQDFDDGHSSYQGSRFAMEKTLIQRYMTGMTYIEYENWNGRAASDNRKISTYFSSSFSDAGSGLVKTDAIFHDYSFLEQTTKNLFFGLGIDLHGSASLADHSKVYLESGL